MRLSLNDLLLQKLRSFPKGDDGTSPRVCLVGVGSDLRGDDSAGVRVARALQQHTSTPRAASLLVVEGGLAPENHTGELRAFHPALVILVDAAHLGQPPGTVQWVPLETIDGMSASSHSLPLSMLASYLTFELNCEVAVLGIQPQQNEFDTDLSLPVRAAVDQIMGSVRQLLLF